MLRRNFLLSGLALLAPRTSFPATARIEILPDEEIGTISPHVYGQFTEHIGGVIYDGVWVGENSKVPNIGGIRKELVDRLKQIKVPVIRWPGGCFADSYNWRDGVGPRDRRPKRTNFWANDPDLWKGPDGPQKYDPNQFGTNEFARFCRLAGAEPYFAANLRSLEPFDFYEWVEYCNSPAGTTSLADTRAQGGSRDPFRVRFWGVGNESWGCGGSFTGDEYAIEFRRYTEWVPRYGMQLDFIASGPNVADYAWTRSFFEKLTEKGKGTLRHVFGTALHYYCGGPSADNSTEFTPEAWYSLLSSAGRMEELINNHWQIMGEIDTEHHVKLVVDEWGAWHETDPSIAPNYLFGYYAAILVFYSFSAVAQQTGSAVPPPFQAKRLPPEKAVSVDSSQLATQLSPLQDVLPPTPGHSETPVTSGTSVPPGFKPRTDVQLSKTAQDAVQMSEKWMAEHNQPFTGQDGRVLYSYGAGLPTVVCAPLRVCIIELQSGEKLAGEPHIGDSVRWNISPAMFGHGDSATTLIVLKPQIAGLDTNLLITTDRRAYYLRLLSKPEDYVARVAFAYPNDESSSSKWQEQIAKQKQEEQKNTIAKLPDNSVESVCFDYRVKGKDDALKPVRVFDDGQKTFLQISRETRTRETPVLVVLGRDGKQEMVNYRVKGDMYIVDRLFDRAELILGTGKKAQKVEIQRERKS